jgi:hypothetical protein
LSAAICRSIGSIRPDVSQMAKATMAPAKIPKPARMPRTILSQNGMVALFPG